ncbi:MAG: cation-translocating P-type ATPase, partial [Chloroflexi bacterium]|nr:cation-translocating P-type ATPase [Chloroflexota bacterium]
ATAVSTETVVGQIGRLLHQALWQRAPVERLADKLASWLVPIAVALAIATFAVWTWQADMETGLIYALSVLLIACPCALGIATPLTLWVGLGRAANAGVILRHTGVLEQLANIQQVFFDKTGTLTKRPIRLQEVAVNGVDEDSFLARVTAVESHSEHPLGQAIAQQFTIHNPQFAIYNFRSLPGQGVTALVDDSAVWIGNRGLMTANDLTIPPSLQKTGGTWRQDGLIVIYAGWDGQVRGLLGLGEAVREETAVTIAQIQDLDLAVTVLTGDDKSAGERWQKLLGIPVHAEQKPVDKVARLQNGAAAMVGDGINDGPALAAAAVGMAVRQGTDVAQSAADVILMREDLEDIPRLIILARATIRKVRQNLAWAVIYNAIGLLLAMGGRLQPSVAALLMVFSNLIVTANALRLRKLEIRGWGLEIEEDVDNLQSPISDLSPKPEHIKEATVYG